MKRIYLSLLPCLASLLASAQEPLNGDSLASDFRYLVKELAATHPDPYSGFGGKVFFYEQAFHLENELRRTPGTKQTFFDKVSIFLSNLQDEHTYLLPPTANQQANQRYLALEVRTLRKPNVQRINNFPLPFKFIQPQPAFPVFFQYGGKYGGTS